jgi:hypothetical protein
MRNLTDINKYLPSVCYCGDGFKEDEMRGSFKKS